MTRSQRHATRPAGRRRRITRDGARGLGALVVLTVLLVAPPLILMRVVGNPIHGLAGFSLTKPLTDSAVTDILAIVMWVAWTQLAACVLAEVTAAVRGIALPRRLPMTLGFQRMLARNLVVAVFALLSATPMAAMAAGQASPSVTVAAQTIDGIGTLDVATVTAASSPPASVVVQPGDDLSDIASAELGSANRWVDIWDLNQGRPQPFGETFNDPSLIRPGWTLRLPTTNRLHAAPPEDGIELTVQPHDSLWALAETHLGSGARWSEIWTANRGTVQADGRRLTDPAKIQPGWILRIPGSHPNTPAAPRPVSTPAASRPTAAPNDSTTLLSPTQEPSPTTHHAPPDGESPPVPQPTTSTPPVAVSSPDSTPTPARDANGGTATREPALHSPGASSSDSAPTHQIGLGLTGIAAAAVVGAIGRRRVLQQRRRRAGRRIAMPGPQLSEAELALRAVEDTAAVRLLDRVARTVMLSCQRSGAVFPEVAVIRLFRRGVEFILTSPAPAVEPFVAAGDRLWRFDATTAGHLLATDDEITAEDIAFPFPLLVTIGVDDRGPVMVNLETGGALTVIGDTLHTLPVLHAAAAELATSALSEMATVQLIGVGGELAASTETGRATAHDELSDGLVEPSRFHAEMSDELVSSQCATMHEARSRGQAELTWPSHAVIYAGPLDADTREQIITSGVAVPGCGTGIITAAATVADAMPGWILRPSTQLRLQLEPFGLTVSPQQLSEADLADVTEILAVSGDLTDRPPTDPTWAAAATVTAAAASMVTGSAVTPDSQLALRRPPAEVHPDLHHEARRTTPMVRILGHVTISDARGEPPHEKLAKATEIAAYLALHADANRDRITQAIWPVKRITANYRQQLMSSLRGWLGIADDGEQYLGLYELHADVRCDWTSFETLAKQGFAAGADGLPHLEAALALVRDRPFVGVRSGTYAWADVLIQQQIIPAICDVAEAVATIHLANGEPAAARAASARGLLVEPWSETLLRLALRAAHLRGDAHDLRELIARVDRIQDELDDNDPETIELLAFVRNTRSSV
jgi:hypothetical protein